MRFNKLLEETIQCLDPYPSKEIQLPDEFAQVQREEKEGVLTLRNRFLDIGDYGQFRSVIISSPKINIITVFFFPLPCRQLPVFAMEFVVLGKQPIVGVVDAKCLLNTMECRFSISKTLEQIHLQFSHLVQANDPPEWYQDCRSGNDFFIRPKDEIELDALSIVHSLVWRSTINLFMQSHTYNNSEASLHDTCIQVYKDHHRVNSPGYRLMNRSFGHDWTQEYLSNYLFH